MSAPRDDQDGGRRASEPGRERAGDRDTEGPEAGRTVRGKPGTEAAKRAERDRDRTGASQRRASTPPDPDEQTDTSGTAKKIREPFEEGTGS